MTQVSFLHFLKLKVNNDEVHDEMPYGDEMPATEFQQFIRLRKDGELDIYSFVDVYYGILVKQFCF